MPSTATNPRHQIHRNDAAPAAATARLGEDRLRLWRSRLAVRQRQEITTQLRHVPRRRSRRLSKTGDKAAWKPRIAQGKMLFCMQRNQGRI